MKQELLIFGMFLLAVSICAGLAYREDRDIHARHDATISAAQSKLTATQEKGKDLDRELRKAKGSSR